MRFWQENSRGRQNWQMEMSPCIDKDAVPPMFDPTVLRSGTDMQQPIATRSPATWTEMWGFPTKKGQGYPTGPITSQPHPTEAQNGNSTDELYHRPHIQGLSSSKNGEGKEAVLLPALLQVHLVKLFEETWLFSLA